MRNFAFAALAVAGAAAAGALAYLNRKEIEEFTKKALEKAQPTEKEGVYASDLDGDGKIDTVAADTTGDGQVDTILADTDGDGIMDKAYVDTTGDGKVDTVLDLNGQEKPAE